MNYFIILTYPVVKKLPKAKKTMMCFREAPLIAFSGNQTEIVLKIRIIKFR